LQQQIDDLKDQVAGYKVVDGGWFSAGFWKGYTYFNYALCPFGMKPVGFGGDAIAYEGVYDEKGNPTGNPGVQKDGVLLMTTSKPFEETCTTPEGGGNPYTLYGWKVSWYNNYQGPAPWIASEIRVYVICVGEEKPEPGCKMN
jgi:hypothetical protein